MLVETAKTPIGPSRPGILGRRGWLGVVAAAVLIAAAGAALLTVNAGGPREALDRVGTLWPAAKELKGLGTFSGKGQILRRYVREIPLVSEHLTNLPKAYLSQSSVPALILDIKFKHLKKLHDKRAAALAQGFLAKTADDFVPARLRLGDKSHRVKIRLKGDMTDHYNTEKWSLRVQVRRGGHIFGMRRFSLQAPKTRQYHSQPLYLDFMRQNGVLAPRYLFVHLWVNGTDIGLMAMEEHFSKELLESQGRRESVLLAFDESLAWERWAEWDGGHELASFFNDYTNARARLFQFGRVRRSPQLRADYRIAIGLLRAFVDGRLSASQVFDIERLGQYIATAQLWSSRHDTGWNNQRFYYNPIAARLEPVAYDAKFEYWEDDIHSRLIEISQPLVLRMLSDPVVFESYYRSLRRMTKQVLEGGLLADLAKRERELWIELAGEFPLLEKFPLDALKRRAQVLSSMSRQELTLTIDNPQAREHASIRARRPLIPPFSQLVHGYLLETSGGPVLEIRNAMPDAVEVRSLAWSDGDRRFPFEAKDRLSLPLVLDGKTLDVAARPHLIPYVAPVSKTPLTLLVETRRLGGAGGGESVWSEAVASVPVLSARPIPSASVSETLSRHDFLRLDAASGRLVARPGDWTVSGDLVVPAGVGLEVSGGTRLRFGRGSALIAYGPLHLEGAKGAPIVLEGAQEVWQGVAVLQAGSPSAWRHVEVRDTTGVSRDGWSLTGGVTFYRSRIEMSSVRLLRHRGEDALNIVSTTFVLRDVDIEETASDAFDSDFSTGRVVGGVYRRIGGTSGGDGIDVSGSTVTVEGVRFEGVSDKALSVGEGSRMEARDIRIDDAGTGAASKDGSSLVLTDSVIEGSRVAGLMAYQKKPVYGAARLEARGVRMTGDAPAGLVQTDSELTIDGARIAARKLNVDRLYDTVMRKAVTR